MRIGTAGTGAIVETILTNVAKVEGISCEAVYSRTEERGRRLADKFGVEKVYTEYEAMLADETVEFIYIALPNTLHYAYAKQALEAGKHVLCEKPFTTKLSEAEELLAIAREKGLYLIEMNTTFWHPNYAWIRENLDKIGKLQMISCTFCQYSSRYDDLKNGIVTNIFNPEFGGGALMDINVYNISFVTGLCGKPEEVTYFANRYENGVDTSGILVMKYKEFVCQCMGAKDCWADNGVQILGDRGSIYMPFASNNCQSAKLVLKGQLPVNNCQEGQNVKKEVLDQEVSVEGNQWFHEVQQVVNFVENHTPEECYARLQVTMDTVAVLEQCR